MKPSNKTYPLFSLRGESAVWKTRRYGSSPWEQRRCARYKCCAVLLMRRGCATFFLPVKGDSMETPKVSGGRYLLRVLAVLFLPLTVTLAFSTVVALIQIWGQNTGILYMRLEPLLFAFIPLLILLTVALILKWTRSTKAALRLFAIGSVLFFTFVGTAGLFETIKTKPIVAAASTFRELPGLTREIGTNGDKFSPATSGFVPCIDFIGFGCPNITRTWDSERELTLDDLQKILDDSGWKDVKIQHDQCHMVDLSYKDLLPECRAEGLVGDYKATVSIRKTYDGHWELNMYLRLPTNAR